MRTSRMILAASCVLITMVILFLRGSSRAGLDSLGVAVAGQSTNETGALLTVIQITNRGTYRICFPDSCSVQARGTSKRVYIPTTNLWLKPTEVATISIPAPDPPANWRVAVGYYPESLWNRCKMRLSASSFAPRLPTTLVSVKGAEVWSPWILK